MRLLFFFVFVSLFLRFLFRIFFRAFSFVGDLMTVTFENVKKLEESKRKNKRKNSEKAAEQREKTATTSKCIRGLLLFCILLFFVFLLFFALFFPVFSFSWQRCLDLLFFCFFLNWVWIRFCFFWIWCCFFCCFYFSIVSIRFIEVACKPCHNLRGFVWFIVIQWDSTEFNEISWDLIRFGI